jgi:hypothetical protein
VLAGATAPEEEILKVVAEAHTNDELAEMLVISMKASSAIARTFSRSSACVIASAHQPNCTMHGDHVRAAPHGQRRVSCAHFDSCFASPCWMITLPSSLVYVG